MRRLEESSEEETEPLDLGQVQVVYVQEKEEKEEMETQNLLSDYDWGAEETQNLDSRSSSFYGTFDRESEPMDVKDQIASTVKEYSMKGLEVGWDVLYNFWFGFFFVWKDNWKRKLNLATGITSIFIVVFVVAVMYNSIKKSRLIFFRLAEENMGESDIVLQSRLSNLNQSPFVNATDLKRVLEEGGEDAKKITGFTPRWMIPGYVQNYFDHSKNSSCLFIIMDTKQEKEMGLGRAWTHRPLGLNEAHLKRGLLQATGLQPNMGDKVRLHLDIQGLMSVLSGSALRIEEGREPGKIQEGSAYDVLHDLMKRGGFDFNKMRHFNVTRMAERLHIEIPWELKLLLRGRDTLDFTGEEIFNFVTGRNGTGMDILRLDDLGADYTVVDEITDALGLYAATLGDVVIMDSTTLMETVKTEIQMHAELQTILELLDLKHDLDNFLENFQLEQYAMQVHGQFKGRYETYQKAHKNIVHDMIHLSNDIMSILSLYYPVQIQYPLVDAMQLSEFIALFLDQIFNSVLVLLTSLGIILVYTIMMSNIEEKTYEYAMLRAVGLKQKYLMNIVFTQSMVYAIPAITIGMILALIINFFVEYLISWYVVMPYIDWVMSFWAVMLPICLGFGMPLIANIIPTRRAMSKELRDGLDITHQSNNETTVNMKKLEKLGLEPWQTVLSLSGVLAGFVIYYFIPYTFIFQHIDYFFFIMNSILLSMLFGLCLVSVVLQPPMERFILWCILWGPDRKMKGLISKNLSGHRSRSRKTFLMFVLTTALIIFTGAVFSLQTNSIIQNVENMLGADLIAVSMRSHYDLPEQKLDVFCKQNSDLIESHAYIGFQLTKGSVVEGRRNVRHTRASNLAFFPSRRAMIFPTSENYLDVTKTKYFQYSSYDTSFKYKSVGGKPDIIRGLVSQAGKAHVKLEQPGFKPQKIYSGQKFPGRNDTFDPSFAYHDYVDAIVSTAITTPMSVSQGDPLLSRIYPQKMNKLVKPKAFVYKFPGFFFSKYAVTALSSPMIISEKTYRHLMYQINPQFDGHIRKQRISIKYRKGISSRDESNVVNGIRALINHDFSVIQSVKDVAAGAQNAKFILQWIFDAIAMVLFILCFLNLVVSFTSNVRDNRWEFGVLRSLGLSRLQLLRAYIYEALVLVFSAFFSGTIIGCIIATTLTLQFNIFTQQAFQFDFPWILFFSLLAMSLIVAFFGSWIPSRQIGKKPIAIVLRGLG